MKFYRMALSNNAFRVEMYLKEKGLGYSTVDIDLFKGEHKAPEFTKLFPRGQVPGVQLESGECLYESTGIIECLEHISTTGPALMPAPTNVADSAKFFTRMSEFHQKLDPSNITGSVVFRKMGKEDLKERIEKLEQEVDKWDAYLGDNDFFAGGFSIVDITLFPLIATWVELLALDLSSRSNLSKWYDAVKSRPSVESSDWWKLFSNKENLKGTPFEGANPILRKE